MIQLLITKKARGYARGDVWQRFDSETKNFPSVKEAKDWLKDRYRKSKRVPMFLHLKDGGSKKVGYVYGFRNEDLSNLPMSHWIQQDWVEFREVKTITP